MKINSRLHGVLAMVSLPLAVLFFVLALVYSALLLFPMALLSGLYWLLVSGRIGEIVTDANAWGKTIWVKVDKSDASHWKVVSTRTWYEDQFDHTDDEFLIDLSDTPLDGWGFRVPYKLLPTTKRSPRWDCFNLRFDFGKYMPGCDEIYNLIYHNGFETNNTLSSFILRAFDRYAERSDVWKKSIEEYYLTRDFGKFRKALPEILKKPEFREFYKLFDSLGIKVSVE